MSAIAGHIPSEMTQAMSSFLDVCYIAWHTKLDHAALKAFNTTLAKFYMLQEVFRTSGVRPTGVRGHFYHLTSQMEYVCLNTLNTFCFSTSPYVPPFHL